MVFWTKNVELEWFATSRVQFGPKIGHFWLFWVFFGLFSLGGGDHSKIFNQFFFQNFLHQNPIPTRYNMCQLHIQTRFEANSPKTHFFVFPYLLIQNGVQPEEGGAQTPGGNGFRVKSYQNPSKPEH